MRKLLALAAALACSALLAGCATAFEPKLASTPPTGFDLVDLAKVDRAKYEADYAACTELANQDRVDGKRLASGAVGIVADKASFGLVGGKPGKDADRNSVLKRCLEGRGYHVLR